MADHIRTYMFRADQAEGDGDGLTLEGYAAVFGVPAEINDWDGSYTEIIARGAFKKSLSERTPTLMFEHGQHPLLGSMPIGMIERAAEDTFGLRIRARLHDNWMVDPLRDAIRSGAVSGMSFRFETIKDEWSKDRSQRTVREVRCMELGPVTMPAYRETSLALRSLAAHLDAAGVAELHSLTSNMVESDSTAADEPDVSTRGAAAEGNEPDQSGTTRKQQMDKRRRERLLILRGVKDAQTGPDPGRAESGG